MSKSLRQYQQYLSRVKPWVAVATVFAVALLGYMVSLALGYSSGADEVASLTAEIDRLTAKVQQPPPDEEKLLAEQATHQRLLDASVDRLDDSNPYALVTVLSDVADEAAVSISGISVGDGALESLGNVELWSQPISANVQGDSLDIYQFLALLHEKMPSTRVTNITLSSLTSLPSAQLQIVFYLSPQSAPGG